MAVYPGYFSSLQTGALKKLADNLMTELEDCTICPHHCHVNRQAGELGYCRAGYDVEISGFGPHFGEEPPLVGNYGSGTIFFNHCNLGCIFCQNWDISHGKGEKLSIENLAEIMLELQNKGCHNINLVSPSHYVPQIIAALSLAAEDGLRLPLVYNSSGYDEKITLEQIAGLIDIYMPDFKYAAALTGEQYSCVYKYPEITKTAIKEMYRQVGDLTIDHNIAYRGLIIRHLVLPGKLSETANIMQFIAEEISPHSYVNIMDQYFPSFKATEHSELNRQITHTEYQEAINAAKKASPNLRLAE